MLRRLNTVKLLDVNEVQIVFPLSSAPSEAGRRSQGLREDSVLSNSVGCRRLAS